MINQCLLESKNTKPTREIMGVIESTQPLALFAVRLEDGRRIRASVSEAARHATTRMIPGDRVQVRLSVHDPNRGQITRKL